MIHWEEHIITREITLPKTYNFDLIMRKHLAKQIVGHSIKSVLNKNLNVMKYKGRLRNCFKLKETRDTTTEFNLWSEII